MARRQTEEIRKSLLEEIFWERTSPVKRVARAYAITPQAVQLHLQSLVREGVVRAVGQTSARRYELIETLRKARHFDLTSTTEDEVWRQFAGPLLADLAGAEEDICHYGLTEIVNNAIDHSAGTRLDVSVSLTTASVAIRLTDNGVGIFQKIAAALGLADPRLALIELSKGKLTTDPRRHTGEGIFFASRAFDAFSLRSSDLLFHHSTRTDDWLLDVKDRPFTGTRVTMRLLTPTRRTLEQVFARFSSGPDDHRFAKTHVPLELATFGDESLVSRSSAKRVLARVDRFDEVLLDFAGIRSIGQGFADEIFRVFASEHPKVSLVAINANEQVTGMIRRAESARLESTAREGE